MSRGERIAIVVTLAIAALITGPWFYVQLLEWKAGGHDYMLLMGNIIVTIILWSVLVFAVIRNLRDVGREEILRSEIQTIRDEHETQVAHLGRVRLAAVAQARSEEIEKYTNLNNENYERWRLKAANIFGLLERNLPKATKLEYMAIDIDALKSELAEMVSAVEARGDQLPPELKHPLSAVIFTETTTGFPYEVWHFQRNFTNLRNRLATWVATSVVPAVPDCKFISVVIPNETASNVDVKAILEDASTQLKAKEKELFNACYQDESAPSGAGDRHSSSSVR